MICIRRAARGLLHPTADVQGGAQILARALDRGFLAAGLQKADFAVDAALVGPAQIDLRVVEQQIVLRAQVEGALRESEHALRGSEQALSQAQEIAGIGSWQWDPQTRDTIWSPHMYALYGVAPAIRYRISTR